MATKTASQLRIPLHRRRVTRSVLIAVDPCRTINLRDYCEPPPHGLSDVDRCLRFSWPNGDGEFGVECSRSPGTRRVQVFLVVYKCPIRVVEGKKFQLSVEDPRVLIYWAESSPRGTP